MKYENKYECINDIKLTNITKNEAINLTISDKSMNLYEVIKKLTVARQNGFLFNQINKLTIKFYSPLRYINISYYLKSQTPMCQRQCFRVFFDKIVNIKEIFAMIWKILFILHIRNGSIN